jgi:hypothetical protein
MLADDTGTRQDMDSTSAVSRPPEGTVVKRHWADVGWLLRLWFYRKVDTVVAWRLDQLRKKSKETS